MTGSNDSVGTLSPAAQRVTDWITVHGVGNAWDISAALLLPRDYIRSVVGSLARSGRVLVEPDGPIVQTYRPAAPVPQVQRAVYASDGAKRGAGPDRNDKRRKAIERRASHKRRRNAPVAGGL